jgi:chromosome condensin MukBEF MukE localization factor
MATTTVEIDSDLLARLRERSPGKSDRELLEELATVTLGFETIQRVRQRTAEADVDQQEIEDEAVRVVRERRRRRAAGHAAH